MVFFYKKSTKFIEKWWSNYLCVRQLVSKDEKLKLGLSFVYDAPPGFKGFVYVDENRKYIWFNIIISILPKLLKNVLYYQSLVNIIYAGLRDSLNNSANNFQVLTCFFDGTNDKLSYLFLIYQPFMYMTYTALYQFVIFLFSIWHLNWSFFLK